MNDHAERLRFGVRFTAQVWPGDTLTVRTVVDRVDRGGGTGGGGAAVAELSVSAVNADGVQVLTGYAVAELDP